MASNTIMFQQYTNKHSGDCEFRVTFRRHKAAVFRRHENHFYLDVYDNKLGKTKFNGICVGLDELDFLISIRGNLDQLKSSFPQMTPSTSGLRYGETSHPAEVSWKNNTPFQSYTCVPLNEISNNCMSRQREDEPARKRMRLENISPAHTNDEITKEIMDDFFYPMN